MTPSRESRVRHLAKTKVNNLPEFLGSIIVTDPNITKLHKIQQNSNRRVLYLSATTPLSASQHRPYKSILYFTYKIFSVDYAPIKSCRRLINMRMTSSTSNELCSKTHLHSITLHAVTVEGENSSNSTIMQCLLFNCSILSTSSLTLVTKSGFADPGFHSCEPCFSEILEFLKHC